MKKLNFLKNKKFNPIKMSFFFAKKKPISLKFVVLGTQGVGKTTSILKAIYPKGLNQFLDQTPSTVQQESFTKQIFIDDIEYQINVLDTGCFLENSSEKLSEWCKNADVFLLFFDVSNKKSFESLKFVHDKILITNSDPCIIFIANKTDLDRDVSTKEGKKLASTSLSFYFENSNKISGDLTDDIIMKSAIQYILKKSSQKSKGFFASGSEISDVDLKFK